MSFSGGIKIRMNRSGVLHTCEPRHSNKWMRWNKLLHDG